MALPPPHALYFGSRLPQSTYSYDGDGILTICIAAEEVQHSESTTEYQLQLANIAAKSEPSTTFTETQARSEAKLEGSEEQRKKKVFEDLERFWCPI